MGELILCKKRAAKKPYHIEALSLRIYSLEELCYYIYKNADLIGSELLSKDLTRWMARDLRAKELAVDLEEMIDANAPLHLFCNRLLSSCSYLTSREIREAVSVIEAYENKSPTERKKIKADKLMKKKRFVDAIYAYEDLLKIDALPGQFRGDVCHNLGCAYAKLLFFREAARFFEDAYKQNHRMNSLFSMFYALCMDKDEDGFLAGVENYGLKVSQVDSLKKIYAAAMQSKESQAFAERIGKLPVSSPDGSSLEEIVCEWKADYFAFCRI